MGDLSWEILVYDLVEVHLSFLLIEVYLKIFSTVGWGCIG